MPVGVQNLESLHVSSAIRKSKIVNRCSLFSASLSETLFLDDPEGIPAYVGITNNKK